MENVIVDTGSMQGIDLAGKLMLDPGDTVVLGDPTFLTALQAFSFYRARYLTVPLDDEGMQVDLLPKILETNTVKGRGRTNTEAEKAKEKLDSKTEKAKELTEKDEE